MKSSGSTHTILIVVDVNQLEPEPEVEETIPTKAIDNKLGPGAKEADLEKLEPVFEEYVPEVIEVDYDPEYVYEPYEYYEESEAEEDDEEETEADEAEEANEEEQQVDEGVSESKRSSKTSKSAEVEQTGSKPSETVEETSQE